MPAGDEREAADFLPGIYDDLRALAGAYMRGEREGHTLQPTALVHEAYLRVQQQGGFALKNSGHLRALVTQAMRRVLVDHARARKAAKRGGGEEPVTVQTSLIGSGGEHVVDVLAVEEALAKLERLNVQQARIVELRFFGGLTNREVSETLGISETTVEDHWRFARAWLSRELAVE
jgi:RNA polymerase sigma factor (TIGR02999 family)